MNCYICKQETDYKSPRYVEVVCKDCDEKFIEWNTASDKFRKEYALAHEVCPKCGATNHETTLAGFILDMDDKENYKDLNDCKCMNCGDRHTTHERILKSSFENLQH